MAATSTHDKEIKSNSTELEDMHLNTNWEDVICPICLEFPHNGVLLHCTSFGKGCRPFICDTGHTHSNCLERFKTAYGMSAAAKVTPSADGPSGENFQTIPSNHDSRPSCPLCRGHVTGWVVIDDARQYLNMKKRCCEEKQCAFVGNYLELQKHAKLKHPHARPSEIDPTQQLDWENFQQSSEIIDVLSTIHSGVPHGVVLGDYVIEYGDSDTVDEYEDFPGDEGNWWTSCILYQVFDNFRASRNRRRSRVGVTRRGHWQSSNDASNPDDGSTTSAEITEYRYDETDDEFVGAGDAVAASRESSRHRSYRRRRARFNDH